MELVWQFNIGSMLLVLSSRFNQRVEIVVLQEKLSKVIHTACLLEANTKWSGLLHVEKHGLVRHGQLRLCHTLHLLYSSNQLASYHATVLQL
jgi:hypothetical protein